MNGESMNLNINYLLFQFIHLASEQDDNVNQQEILRLISESSFKTGIDRGSRAHMTRFCCEYGDYLSQLRKNVSRGVIGMVEKEVRDNYATNITLKSLSEKYYVNSAYLGQLFRKKYGQSFKDYLNNYRMNGRQSFCRRSAFPPARRCVSPRAEPRRPAPGPQTSTTVTSIPRSRSRSR